LVQKISLLSISKEMALAIDSAPVIFLALIVTEELEISSQASVEGESMPETCAESNNSPLPLQPVLEPTLQSQVNKLCKLEMAVIIKIGEEA
jgi:hypothetical protein